ncbi:MAG: GspB domain-containing protein [Hydrogenophaga sp.]|uniref:general secretion pathway protein GspB n=1 Tax=Hydrogenophaga sp. TaxID=1904254 RepID=UPI0016954B13|nr:general secretion pathway protein GspB [Hydrogenophaga sp.]NIM43524.1 GspB domain-containing protein [Hydrogenophaga sp.]NIN28593.1 GspB domain-containing protein [Hydrogenophaga sp.]NIN33052.1 GspB domain-containing protein [Hydrogenophaga sp.]NIN57727.1 GspB domain-containing protein [Hydrogenophaga sp.]NIO54022.1 GspB domain-containing protein [Hydrogenophaga sp.]
MSYILDALRRADAERERGRVPGLHTQVNPLRTAEPPSRRRPPRARGPWVAGLGLLMAAAATAWWLMRDGTADPQPAPAPSPTAARATPPAPVPEAPPAPPPRVAAPPVVAAPAQPILAPPPPPPPPAPAPTPAPAPAPAPSTAPGTGGTPAPAAASAAPLPRVNELNPTARAALPPLKISGSTYAENPALRMLILDGQVLQEGQDIAPGLKLESIGPRSAVIVHQGQRLRLPY